jgi:uncharacterized protein (TIGR02453 family)
VAFRGWPAEALEFYEGLLADNTKSYWTEHKATYEQCVRQPMSELLAELEPRFGAGKIFRPYRDVRFSRDKTPYKTHIGAVLEAGGYVQLSADGLAAGSGHYEMDSASLARFRDAVAADASGKELERIVAAVRRAGIDVSAHEQLKTVPRGYDRDHPRAELLRYKGLIAWKQWPVAAWLGTRKAMDRVVGFFDTARPLVDWLDHYA